MTLYSGSKFRRSLALRRLAFQISGNFYFGIASFSPFNVIVHSTSILVRIRLEVLYVLNT